MVRDVLVWDGMSSDSSDTFPNSDISPELPIAYLRMVLSINKPEVLLPEERRPWFLIPGSTGWRDRFLESMHSQRMRTALYTRVSSNDQNCEMQIRELRAYAQARGWEITSEFKDEGWSGTRADRPAFKMLMAEAATRKLDVVLCWKLDWTFID
jgi:hypothetical protein